MTADAETIRDEKLDAALERLSDCVRDSAVKRAGYAESEDRRALAVIRAALAALGRVEERERALTEALEEACDWLDVDLAHAPNTATSMADRELVARWRAALAGSVATGSGAQEQETA